MTVSFNNPKVWYEVKWALVILESFELQVRKKLHSQQEPNHNFKKPRQNKILNSQGKIKNNNN